MPFEVDAKDVELPPVARAVRDKLDDVSGCEWPKRGLVAEVGDKFRLADKFSEFLLSEGDNDESGMSIID